MTSTAIKTAGEGSTGNTAHLNLTVTLAEAWAREAERRTDKKVRAILRQIEREGASK